MTCSFKRWKKWQMSCKLISIIYDINYSYLIRRSNTIIKFLDISINKF